MRRYHAKYRTLWIDAGYKPDMGSACAVKPPPEGWLAAYNFVSLENALDDIKNGHIKVTDARRPSAARSAPHRRAPVKWQAQ
jgi:hypothetical protein